MQHKKRTQFWLSTLLSLAMFLPGVTKSQVTIGDKTAPQPFSLLEISTVNQKRGLRLPQLSTAERDALDLASNPAAAEGLTIYNTTTACFEYWNNKWVSLCRGQADITFDGGDPTDPSFPAEGAERGPFTPHDDPDCTAQNPAYTITVMSGGDYLHITVLNPTTGQFNVTMIENPTVVSRSAIVRVTNDCTREFKEFLFAQDGAAGLCDPSATPPAISSYNGTSLCGNGAAYLYLTNSTDGTDYVWSLNGREVARNVAGYTATQPGIYVVYAGAIGCDTPAPASIAVTEGTSGAPAPVTIIVGENNGFVCSDLDEVTLYASTSAPSSVVWYKDGLKVSEKTGTSISAGIGKWFAVVEDGGCSSIPSNSITVQLDPNAGSAIPAPAFTINGTAASGTVSVCSGGTMLLDITNPQAGVTYTWYVNNDIKGMGTSYELSMIGINSDFVLQCIATNGFQCSSAGVSHINVSFGLAPSRPVIQSSANGALCGGSSTLTTSATASKYRWYKDGSLLTVTTDPNNTYTVSELGAYSLQIVDEQGCVSDMSLPLNITQNSGYGMVSITPQITSVNQNDVRTFTAIINPEDSESSYTWTITGATPATATGKTVAVTFGATGTAQISVLAVNACTPSGVTASESIDVQANCTDAAITAYTPASKMATIIGGGSVSLTVTPNGNPSAFTYQWYNSGGIIAGAVSQSYSASVADTYYCKVQATCVGAIVTSDNFTVSIITIPDDSRIGGGFLSGRTCFDIAQSNFGSSCGDQASRTVNKADFTQASVNTQIYTFTKAATGTVQNVRYAIKDPEGVLLATQSLSGTIEAGTMTYATTTLTLNFKTNLNSSSAMPLIVGRTRNQAAKLTINIIYNDGINDVKVPLTASIQDCACCGAMTTSGKWLNFMCHNLGADESLDPMTYVYGNANGSGGTLGYLYQWGRQSDGHEQRNSPITTTLAANSAATSPSIVIGKFVSDANNSDWISPSNSNLWGATKTANDPCPLGWRVPTQAEWGSIFRGGATNGAPGAATANTWTWTGNGYKVGGALFLPAGGSRSVSSGVNSVGILGGYWSSTANSSNGSYTLVITGSSVNFGSYYPRVNGFSVRCVQQ